MSFPKVLLDLEGLQVYHALMTQQLPPPSGIFYKGVFITAEAEELEILLSLRSAVCDMVNAKAEFDQAHLEGETDMMQFAHAYRQAQSDVATFDQKFADYWRDKL